MNIYYKIISLVFLLCGNVAYGAQFNLDCPQLFGGQSCTLYLYGSIEKGDSAALREILRRPEHKNLYKSGQLDLDSPGGDVHEAIKMVEIMKEWIGTASVSPGSVCASACFIIWIGSPVHILVKNVIKPDAVGKIGLHRPYLGSDYYKHGGVESTSRRQSQVMIELRNFFQGENLSNRLIDVMMRRASNDIYWLNSADIEEIGAHSPYWEEMTIRHCGYSLRQLNKQRDQGSLQNSDSSKRWDYLKWRSQI